jgi:hypothetical protein
VVAGMRIVTPDCRDTGPIHGLTNKPDYKYVADSDLMIILVQAEISRSNGKRILERPVRKTTFFS